MRDRIILNDRRDDFDIAFVAISEEFSISIKDALLEIKAEADKDLQKELKQIFFKTIGIEPKDIISYGSTIVTHKLVDKLIPYITLSKRYKDSGVESQSYCCYTSERWDFSKGFITAPIHVDPMSSWNCAMSICGNPKFGVIVKVKKGSNIDNLKFEYKNV
jgi:hypothetical protein